MTSKTNHISRGTTKITLNGVDSFIYTTDLEETHILDDVAQGLRNNTIDNGDILSIALERSAMKKMREGNMSHDENKPLNINHDGEALGIAVLRSIKKHHKELKVSDIDSVAKVLFDEESPSDTLHMAVEIAINKRQSEKKNSFPNFAHNGSCHILDDNCESNDNDNFEKEDHMRDDSTSQRHTILKSKLKKNVLATITYQFEDILNKGSFEQLQCLRGIGKVRAEKIIDLRSSKRLEIFDLADVGMTEKMIDKFYQSNLGIVIDLLEDDTKYFDSQS